jgi:hypothetical protein
MLTFRENCVEVDQITLKALEIFYADYRPDCIRKKFVWGHNRKEGMSVFKVFYIYIINYLNL